MSFPDYDSWITHNPADDYDEKDITAYHECGMDLDDWDEDDPKSLARSENGLCQFEGEIEALAYVGRPFTNYEWECPSCGHTHTEQVETSTFFGYDEE